MTLNTSEIFQNQMHYSPYIILSLTMPLDIDFITYIASYKFLTLTKYLADDYKLRVVNLKID